MANAWASGEEPLLRIEFCNEIRLESLVSKLH